MVFDRIKKSFDFPYHYHPEVEINFIWKGKGYKRVIGDHTGEIDNLELVLVGPNGDFSSAKAASASGDYFSSSSGKNKIFTAAEAWFLKAEAAIRGYAGAGDAETNYNKGIEASFGEWGKSVDYTAYVNDAVSTEAPYIDPKNSANNILAGNPQLSTITIKWNAADSFERKLERILTQKWIAIYPDGSEAWAEQRRTGYPVIFKNILNDSQGTISTEAMIRRVPIPAKYRNNTLNYAQAVQLLGGADNGGTKLWWDKNP